jgi:hypothetical protein
MKKGKHYNTILVRAYLKYKLSMVIIAEGTTKEMLRLEKKLRSKRNIGWNIAIGGGLPPSNKGISMSQAQKDKISKANKGNIVSEEHKLKMVATRRKNKSYDLMHAKSVSKLDPITLEVLEIFASVALAAKSFKSKVQGNISMVCRDVQAGEFEFHHFR